MLTADSPNDALDLRSRGASLEDILNVESRRHCPDEPLITRPPSARAH